MIVPVYNEELRLAGPLEELYRLVTAAAGSTELIFVDDGSRDATAARLEDFVERCRPAPVRLLRLPENRGKGAAVRTGMLAAVGEEVLFTDLDLSTPLADLATLREHRGAAGVAIGSRAVPGARILRSQPAYRSLGGKAVNLFVQLLAVPGIHDTQCGFKLFRREAAHEVFRRTTLDGFSFDIEALFIARRLGFTIAEVPVTWTDVAGSKVSPLKDGLRLLADLLRIRWRALRGRYR
ncbi:MAG: glycosyltransferase family 2 protein [Acidobacteria bacterium]|nr:glycosyltransferase family 2 protein [Acidobacteriota bacterium]